MKICIDANVLISYLLNAAPERPPVRLLEYALQSRFELMVSETTLTEVQRSVRAKPYLSDRISSDEADDFVRLLRSFGTILPELEDEIPQVSRDRHDDYLIAHAVLEQVDFLVSGDRDLLVLGKIMGVRIVSPAGFVALLDSLPS